MTRAFVRLRRANGAMLAVSGAATQPARRSMPFAAVAQAAGSLAGALAGLSVPALGGTLRGAGCGVTGAAVALTGMRWLRVPQVPARSVWLMHSVQLRL